MMNIFIFRCADPEIQDYHYYFADRPTQNNSPDCLYTKKLSCLRLMFHCPIRGTLSLNQSVSIFSDTQRDCLQISLLIENKFLMVTGRIEVNMLKFAHIRSKIWRQSLTLGLFWLVHAYLVLKQWLAVVSLMQNTALTQWWSQNNYYALVQGQLVTILNTLYTKNINNLSFNN